MSSSYLKLVKLSIDLYVGMVTLI